MFYDFKSLKKLNFPIFKDKNLIVKDFMFRGCNKLKESHEWKKIVDKYNVFKCILV